MNAILALNQAVKKNYIQPVSAVAVRIHPTAWKGSTMAMRAEAHMHKIKKTDLTLIPWLMRGYGLGLGLGFGLGLTPIPWLMCGYGCQMIGLAVQFLGVSHHTLHHYLSNVASTRPQQCGLCSMHHRLSSAALSTPQQCGLYRIVRYSVVFDPTFNVGVHLYHQFRLDPHRKLCQLCEPDKNQRPPCCSKTRCFVQ